MNYYPIKRALISVSNKEGVLPFAQQLHALGVEIISTGGSAALLKQAGIPVIEVAEVTGFPEIMDGRLKTLHPKVHGGILGRRDSHATIAEQHQIEWIDLVVVNLYPFSEVSQRAEATDADIIENIDIGGPTMIRSAAKNMAYVTVVVDQSDYPFVLTQIEQHQGLDDTQRRALAEKAFMHTANYDAMIFNYLHRQTKPNEFPDWQLLALTKERSLRYGENPDQQAAVYRSQTSVNGILGATQHQGKELSYNNIVDAEAAVAIATEFTQPACVIVKHANPCGVAIGQTIEEAFIQALDADKLSAFGGIIALNQTCDAATATLIAASFFEVLVAPAITADALAILAKKTNLRVLSGLATPQQHALHYQFLSGTVLVQNIIHDELSAEGLKIVTEQQPHQAELTDALFAWKVAKHVKSNAIVLAKGLKTIGIGPGQVSRVDALQAALNKAGTLAAGSVVASDGFFPFRDCIDLLANAQVAAVIQPGGSIRDDEVITACNEHAMAMMFTERRCFKH